MLRPYLRLHAMSGNMDGACRRYRDRTPANVRQARQAGAQQERRTSRIRVSFQAAEHQRVEQMAWVPGQPALIHDRLSLTALDRANEGHLPQLIRRRGSSSAMPVWLALRLLTYTIFLDDDYDHILRWLAQRKQKPDAKINHGLLLGTAERLERTWRGAGRTVVQLIPDHPGDDFNDIVLRGRL